MAHLRAYYWNRGDMLELVRYQKEVLPKASGGGEVNLSCEAMLRSEKNKKYELGKYMESISHSLGVEAKKHAWFNSHIWGL